MQRSAAHWRARPRVKSNKGMLCSPWSRLSQHDYLRSGSSFPSLKQHTDVIKHNTASALLLLLFFFKRETETKQGGQQHRATDVTDVSVAISPGMLCYSRNTLRTFCEERRADVAQQSRSGQRQRGGSAALAARATLPPGKSLPPGSRQR